MENLITALFFTSIFLANCWGWGLLWAKFSQEPLPLWPLTSICGMAVVIGLGSILMAFESAGAIPLTLILLIGIGTSLFQLIRHRNALWSKRTLQSTCILLPTIIFAVALAYRFAAPTAFNLHDDYEKYLTYPVRILENGALTNRTLDAVPMETMGGHAFLQSFIAMCLPLDWVNLLDSVIAATLLYIAVTLLAFHVTRSIFWALALLTLAISINPFYVNISSIYTSAAFFFLISYLIFIQARKPFSSHPKTLAILLVALVSLKSLNILPAAIFSLIYIGITIRNTGTRNKDKKTTFNFILNGIIATLPWIWIYHHEIIHTINKNTSQSQDYTATKEPISLLSTKPLFYGTGESLLTYTLILSALAAAGFVTVLASRKKMAIRCAILITIIIILHIVNIHILSPALLGIDHSMRYMAPIIIAGIPLIYIGLHKTKCTKLAIRGCLIISLILITPNCFKRLKKAFINGNMISYINDTNATDLINYKETFFNKDTLYQIREIQNQIPEGEAIMVWSCITPIMDHKRNPIFLTNSSGLTNPWIIKGQTNQNNLLKKLLHDKKIKYIIFSIHDFDKREKIGQPGNRTQKIAKTLESIRSEIEDISKQTTCIYKDEFFQIYKLSNFK